jgi:hypothetical protein
MLRFVIANEPFPTESPAQEQIIAPTIVSEQIKVGIFLSVGQFELSFGEPF